jgi:hypothetical protein
MEPPDPSVDFEAWVIYTRLTQGLPAQVEDLAVLARIADLFVWIARLKREGIDRQTPCYSSAGACHH